MSAYKIPTETPESDGTIKWNRTTPVLVEIFTGNKRVPDILIQKSRQQR